ncbi:MAG: FliM/FliN family flagellar motor switch protein, partial [Planctomycetota bacterium]
LEPGGARVLIELPLPLCHLLCARVMGLPGGPQAGQPLSAQDAMPVRPLGEVDKGILELLCVKLLHEVQAAWGASAELTLTLERLLGGNDRRLTQMLPPGPIVNASIALEFDQMRESVRLAIPAGAASTLAERLPRSTDRAGQTTEELYFRYRELIDLARVEFACRIGEMKVSRTEWAQLELGAICFPDQLDLTIEGETVAGTVEAYPAYGTGGAKIHTRLTEYGAPLKVTIESIETEGAQRPESTNGNEAAMTEAQAGAPQEHVGEGVGMLDAVPMAMVIELGRLSMTVRDLAALRRGQVLELGSGADDPVNLVVDGHLVGQGKLVNVEGEIGIQIIDLMR